MTKQDTITLIQKMISLNQREHTITLIKKMILLNQREQAARTYKMANETWPEWELKAAFEAMKAKQ